MSSFLSLLTFWLIAILFVAAAVALVVTSLFRKRKTVVSEDRRSINIAIYQDQMKELENDQRNGLLSVGQFEASKLEIEARLALDAIDTNEITKPVTIGTRRLGWSLGTVIPAVVFGVYFIIGNPGAIISPAIAQSELAANNSQNMDELLKKVEDKASENPEDVEAHMLLAKTYSMLARWKDAEKTYATANKLAPENATVLANYAEAIAKVSDRKLKGRPAELLRKALEINPKETKALELSGMRAYQEEEFALAGYYWKRLVKQLPPDDPYTKDMTVYMKQAKTLAAKATYGMLNDYPIEQKTLTGMLEISPDLKAKLKGTETVYFFAGPVGDSDKPLIKMSTLVNKLPLKFNLDDSMTNVPGKTLSDHENLTLAAHISMTGKPEAQIGDFEGQLKTVNIGSKDLKLVIDTVRQ